MKTIEDVQQFITDFIDWEYKVKRGTLDFLTTIEQQAENANYYLQYFYSRQWIPLISGGLTTKPQGVDSEILQKNLNRIRKRKCFIIRQYENATFGKGIYNTSSSTLFSATFGSNTTLEGIELYSLNLGIGIIEGNLKILAVRTKSGIDPNGKIRWDVHRFSSAIDDGNTILNDGAIVDILRVEAPEYRESLLDYNID